MAASQMYPTMQCGATFNFLETKMEFKNYFQRQQINHITEVFSNVDIGQKGYLTRDELKLAVVELFGYKPSKYEVDEILSKEKGASSHTPGDCISKEYFFHIMNTKFSMQDENDELRQIFVAFDTKCRGFIGLDDAKSIFELVAPFIKSFDLQRMFKEVDRDGDGRVSYRDFECMMKSISE